jgi:hypothetical protein
MFSKPIMIAASVAAANATLMAKTATALSGKSDAIGCGKCIGFNDATVKFVLGGATADKSNYWATVATWAKTEVATESLKGDACCVDANTTETGTDGTQKTFCTKGNIAFAADKLHSHLALATNDFFQSALAQCPHNTTNCSAAVVDSKAASITPADLRYIKLEALGSIATLTIKVLKTGTATGEVGAAPEFK